MRIRTTIGSAAAATALVVAGAIAIPAFGGTEAHNINNTAFDVANAPAANELAANPAAAVTELAAALERDLGITPAQFLAQANTAEQLGTLATQWQERFGDAYGGVWMDDNGRGFVGIADAVAGQRPGPDARAAMPSPTGPAADLRAAATAAGFQTRDVALSEGELQSRMDQVKTLVAGIPAEDRALIKDIRADRTKGEIIVTTEGGTEAQLGNITAALNGLARVETLNPPSPANDTAPFGSLSPEEKGAAKDGPAIHPGAVTPKAPGSEKTTTAPSSPEKDKGAATETQVPKRDGDSPAKDGNSLESVLTPEAYEAFVQLLKGSTASLGAAGIDTGSLSSLLQPSQPDPQPRPEEKPREETVPQPQGDAVIGGTSYDAKLSHGKLACSTGFNGMLGDTPVVITAAHCNRSDGVRAAFANGEEFGTFAETKAAGLDTALIRVDRKHASRFRNNLVGVDGGTQPITGTAKPVVGQSACKMGARTGFSCGKIRETGAKIDVAGQRTLANAFTVDVCSLPGDSGGVVFSGNRALGISSASNVAAESDCANATRNTANAGVEPLLSVVPIDDVLAAHPGLRLNTN